MLYRCVTLSISIECPVKEVYDFLAEPLNLPTWTVAVERIAHLRDNDWVAQTGIGEIIFRYQRPNEFGVLDFSMWRAGEQAGHPIPVRVFPNGDGTEVTFSAFQRPGIDDAAFESEIEWTRTDLLTLKSLMETRASRS